MLFVGVIFFYLYGLLKPIVITWLCI